MALHMRYPPGIILMVLTISRFVGAFMAEVQSPGVWAAGPGGDGALLAKPLRGSPKKGKQCNPDGGANKQGQIIPSLNDEDKTYCTS